MDRRTDGGCAEILEILTRVVRWLQLQLICASLRR